MDIERLKDFIKSKRYTVKSHAVRHMIEEGFDEDHLIEAFLGGKILEEYLEEDRCLIVGYFHFTKNVRSPFHIVADFSDEEYLDVVTAYIPQKPFWETPRKRRRR